MPIIRIGKKIVYFAHVPRAAGTSIERYLSARFGPLAFRDEAFLSVSEYDRWTRSSPQHITKKALARLFPAGFFDASFAVVRDPRHRIHSVFLRQRDIEKTIEPKTVFHDWLQSLPLAGHALDNHTRSMLDFIPSSSRIFRLEDGLDAVVDWIDGIAENKEGPRKIGVFNSHNQRLARLGLEIPAERSGKDLNDDAIFLITQRYEADMFWCGYS